MMFHLLLPFGLSLASLYGTDAKMCRILSFSGGGTHGAYESGVVKGLHDKCGVKSWDVYAGISAGSLNAAWLSTIKADSDMSIVAPAMADLWTKTLNTHTMAYHFNPLRILDFKYSDSLLNDHPLKENVHKILGGRGHPKVPIIIGTVSLTTGIQSKFSQPEINKTIDNFCQTILASCSIPGIFSPVELDGDFFVDGGTTHNEILGAAVEGCPPDADIALDVILTGPRFKSKYQKSYNYLEVMLRGMDIQTYANEDYFLNTATQNPRIKHLKIYRPENELPGTILDFSQMEELVSIGHDTATCA